jgi:hypothetical protein
MRANATTTREGRTQWHADPGAHVPAWALGGEKATHPPDWLVPQPAGEQSVEQQVVSRSFDLGRSGQVVELAGLHTLKEGQHLTATEAKDRSIRVLRVPDGDLIA